MAITFSRHAHLDAEHEVGVLGHRLGGGLGLRVVDVVELGHREAGEADVGDVHEGVEARRGSGRRRQRRKAAKLLAPASPAETSGGGGLERDEFVGGDADRGAVGEHVGVQVDEAGRHQLAGGVQHALSACRREYRPPAPRSGRSGCRCRVWPAGSGSGSSTSPPLTRRSNLSFGPMAASAGRLARPVAASARPDADWDTNCRRVTTDMGVPPAGLRGTVHPCVDMVKLTPARGIGRRLGR